MRYDDSSPSCGAPQCQPAAPPQPQFGQPQSRPPVPALAAPAASGTPVNPLHAVQGQVLQQDILLPSTEVYGEGAVYGPAQTTTCSASTAVTGCYSPAEREEHVEVFQPTPVITRASTSQLSRPTQVVTYGLARSDDPASYMPENYQPEEAVSQAPVVGMVQYVGRKQRRQPQQQYLPPPVRYGYVTAPGAPIYSSPNRTSTSASSSSVSPSYIQQGPLSTTAGQGPYTGRSSALMYVQYSAAPPDTFFPPQ